MLRGLVGQAKHNVREGHQSLAIHYYQLAYNELLKVNQGSKHIEEMTQLADSIKSLKAAHAQVSDEPEHEGGEADSMPGSDQTAYKPAVDNASGAS